MPPRRPTRPEVNQGRDEAPGVVLVVQVTTVPFVVCLLPPVLQVPLSGDRQGEEGVRR